MLSVPLLLLVIAAGLLGVFWQNSLGARERANRAAQEACERMNVQFLDGTVAFAHIGLARDAGRLTWRRTYVFDYTAASIDRREGFVTLLGQRIESVGFAPDSGDQPATRLATRHSGIDTSEPRDAKVLNIEDWRQRRTSGQTIEQKPDDQGW